MHILLPELATTMHELEEEKSALESDPDKLQVLFKEMIQMCLWCVRMASPTHLHFIHSSSQGKRYRMSRPSSPATDLPYIAYVQDLSLLTHMTHEDIQHLQSVGKEAQQARQEFILKDDQNAVWEHVKTLKDARVDFVLDNGAWPLRIERQMTVRAMERVMQPASRCVLICLSRMAETDRAALAPNK